MHKKEIEDNHSNFKKQRWNPKHNTRIPIMLLRREAISDV